jgi:hypothetical protein
MSHSTIFHLHCRWRAAKFRPMLGAQGLWARRDLYRSTPTMTRDLSFSALLWRTAPFSHLLQNAWGCRGPILTGILTGYPKGFKIGIVSFVSSKISMKQSIQRMCFACVYDKSWSFQKGKKGSRSWYQMKGLARRNTHVKFMKALALTNQKL